VAHKIMGACGTPNLHGYAGGNYKEVIITLNKYKRCESNIAFYHVD